MQICSQCGYLNDERGKFCTECGAKLAQVVAMSPTPPPVPVPPSPSQGGEPLDRLDAPTSYSKTQSELPEQELFDRIQLEFEDQEPAPRTALGEEIAPPITGSARVAPATPVPVAESTRSTPSLPGPAPGPVPKLVVIRGERLDVEYPLYAGKNYIGRTDEKPVDIDLEDQERSDKIWSSRQHAIVHFENGVLSVEDLNSLNGTFVNRVRLVPGQSKILRANDVLQVGTVQMRVVFG